MTSNEVPYQFCLSRTVWTAADFLARGSVVENYRRILEEQHVLGKQVRESRCVSVTFLCNCSSKS